MGSIAAKKRRTNARFTITLSRLISCSSPTKMPECCGQQCRACDEKSAQPDLQCNQNPSERLTAGRSRGLERRMQVRANSLQGCWQSGKQGAHCTQQDREADQPDTRMKIHGKRQRISP